MMEFLLKSKFMKGLLSKVVTKMVVKNLDCDVDIRIEDLDVTTDDDDAVNVSLCINGKMKKEDLEKLVKKYI